jgi:hypothetical protein
VLFPQKFIIDDNSKVLSSVSFRYDLIVNFVLENKWSKLVGNSKELAFVRMKFYFPGLFPNSK